MSSPRRERRRPAGAAAGRAAARAGGRGGSRTSRLEIERDGAIVTLRLPDAGRGARLGPALHAELCGAAEAIEHDEAVRVVLLASRGPAFCLGEEGDGLAVGAEDGIAAVAALRVPVVALLHGDALDAGLELALACDLRLCAPAARLGLTQIARGALPVHGGTQRLPRVVGRSRALAMVLLGEVVRGREALALGLAHGLASPRSMGAAGRRLAAELASRGPIALRLAKEALRAALDLPLVEGLRLEGDLYVLLQATTDRDEGIASFREKRRPRFAGR